MDSTLNITPEGSLGDIPIATGGNANLMEAQQMLEVPEPEIGSNIPIATGGNANLMEAQQILEVPEPEIGSNQPPTTLPDRAEGTPYTSVKVLSERTSDGQMARYTDIPRRVQ